MKFANKITVEYPASPDELLSWHPGESEPQPVLLVLDLRSGRLECRVDPNAGGAVSEAEYNHLVLRWQIAALTDAAAARLLVDVKSLAEVVLAGASTERDPANANLRGAFNESAREAIGVIEEVTEALREEARAGVVDTVRSVGAGDWYAAGGSPAEDGVTASTTDEELDEIVERVEAQVAAMEPGAVTVPMGFADHLRATRDEMRESAQA